MAHAHLLRDDALSFDLSDALQMGLSPEVRTIYGTPWYPTVTLVESPTPSGTGIGTAEL